MAFQAFLDDSGSGPPIFVLGGYISSVDWWEAFSDDWQGLLDEPPKLAYFKMEEAASRSGQFAGMKIAARNKRLSKFLKLISLAAHASASAVISVAAYNRIMKGQFRKEWDDPYFVALFDLVIKLTKAYTPQRVSGRLDGVLDFIFDDNPRLAAKVPYWYQLTRIVLPDDARNSIGASPRFENDKDFLPLQAADLQSWYYRRLFAEKFAGEPFKKDLPKELFAPLDRIESALSFWGGERMRLSVEQFKQQRKLAEPSPSKTFKNIHDLIANADMS